MDRIHRLGLEEHERPLIEILVSENSIDQVVWRRLNEKITAMLRALNDHEILPNPVDFDNHLDVGDDINEEDIQDMMGHLR